MKRNILMLLALVLVTLTSLPALAVERVYTEPYADEMVRGAGYGVVSVDNAAGYTMTGTVATPALFPKEQAYTFRATAGTLEISSTSADDAAAGTGARTIVIEGLDSAYAPITETITMNGVNADADVLTSFSSKSFLRVNKAYVATKGSGGVNAGDIYIHWDHAHQNRTTGIPATAAEIMGVILAGEGQMRSSHYTAPLGYSGYISELFGSSDVGTVGVSLNITEPTKGLRVPTKLLLGTGLVQRDVCIPVAEKEDILLKLTTADSRTVHFGYKLFLKKN